MARPVIIKPEAIIAAYEKFRKFYRIHPTMTTMAINLNCSVSTVHKTLSQYPAYHPERKAKKALIDKKRNYIYAHYVFGASVGELSKEFKCGHGVVVHHVWARQAELWKQQPMLLFPWPMTMGHLRLYYAFLHVYNLGKRPSVQHLEGYLEGLGVRFTSEVMQDFYKRLRESGVPFQPGVDDPKDKGYRVMCIAHESLIYQEGQRQKSL